MKKKSWLLVGGIVIVVALGGWTIWNGTSQQTGDEIQLDPVVTPATSTTPPAVKALEISPSPAAPSGHPSVDSEHPNSTSSPSVVSETKPDPTPTETPVLQPEKEKKHVEVPLTKPEKTTEPTEPPKPKVKEPEKEQSPAAPPEYEEKETQPNKETATTPKAGDKNSKDQVYVPGFGWVEDQGGGTKEIETGSDGDINKQVGNMD
ncbi:hypothetical protein D3C74_135630 [compost metagenome]